MSFMTFFNLGESLDAKAQTAIRKNLSDVARVSTMPIQRALSSAPQQISPYEGKGASRRERMIWGASRWGGQTVVS